MLIKILLGLVVVVLVLIVVISLRPDRFHVERSLAIAAPPEALFAQTQDLRQYRQWNPWAQVDPEMNERFEGPSAGVGAIYHWESRKVGTGRMQVIEARPGERVRLHLDFLKPMKSTSTAEFTFRRQGEQTLVTWSMAGPQTFAGKAAGLFMNFDRMIGGEFEKGLRQLKTLAESPTTAKGTAGGPTLQ